jgi:hypothetical protein
MKSIVDFLHSDFPLKIAAFFVVVASVVPQVGLFPSGSWETKVCALICGVGGAYSLHALTGREVKDTGILKIVPIFILLALAPNAKAITLDPGYSVGLGTPAVICSFNGKCGAASGTSAGITADLFSTEILGHKAHLLSLGVAVLAFKDPISGSGFLSTGIVLATLEKAFGVTFAVDAYSTDATGANTGYAVGNVGRANLHVMLTYTVNFAFGPFVPALEAKPGAGNLKKANTVYLPKFF